MRQRAGRRKTAVSGKALPQGVKLCHYLGDASCTSLIAWCSVADYPDTGTDTTVCRGWRPDSFEYDTCGCQLRLQFPVVKLIDWIDSDARLADSQNHFAFITRIHSRPYSARRLIDLIDAARTAGAAIEVRSYLRGAGDLSRR